MDSPGEIQSRSYPSSLAETAYGVERYSQESVSQEEDLSFNH